MAAGTGAETGRPQAEIKPSEAASRGPQLAPTPAPAVATASERIKASPLAKKIAAEKGVELSSVSGTGPGGRIIKRDVESATPAPAAAARPFVARPTGEDRLVPASPMRKTIAKRLVEAKLTVPHFYLSAEATVDRLLALRTELNEVAPIKISVNDLIVKALALALVRVPDANASWAGDAILYHGAIDIGVAVSVPDGLITPSVRHADQKGLAVIAAEVKELAERARAKKLRPEEYSGGSATVSNLGMFGISEFKAIINPPESVILAVGQTQKKPIVVDDKVVIAQRMALSLSCDHRVVDGVLGAKLLGELVSILEKPASFLL
jgi:pyruvate dehydrogenase E2 component (dihydrolipoamide acetyltransferase)